MKAVITADSNNVTATLLDLKNRRNIEAYKRRLIASQPATVPGEWTDNARYCLPWYQIPTVRRWRAAP